MVFGKKIAMIPFRRRSFFPSLLIALGAVKTTHEWTGLSDVVRWQSLKSVALIGILLNQLGQNRRDFMQEPTAQIGRLLALADSLHQQYCKHVRKGESPSQLIGNALFNTALDQPLFALARLAERLTPYQAWARTFQSKDPDAGVGLVKYLLGEIAACTAAIRLEELPQRLVAVLEVERPIESATYFIDDGSTEEVDFRK